MLTESDKKAKSEGIDLWDFPGTGEKYVLNLQNSALTYTSGKLSDKADVTVTLQRATLNSILTGATTFEKEYRSKNITIDGSIVKLLELMGMMDSFSQGFNIVTP
jgi:alkyl sulfatase BDS1-like metallo-beta-lactamase superfamily hydrolase